jgi:hypothetical protein
MAKTAIQQVKDAAEETFGVGRASAAQVYKGYNARTGSAGYHFEDFGSSEAIPLGDSAEEAVETLEQIAEEKEASRS